MLCFAQVPTWPATLCHSSQLRVSVDRVSLHVCLGRVQESPPFFGGGFLLCLIVVGGQRKDGGGWLGLGELMLGLGWVGLFFGLGGCVGTYVRSSESKKVLKACLFSRW